MTPEQIARALSRMTPAELAEVAALEAQIAADVAAHPLAYSTLWHRALPRTSQRRAAQIALTPGIRRAFMLGGNRAGKSALGANITVAYALGRDHPDVKAWAKRNHLDVSAIQRGPGRVASGALSLSDARRYVRPAITALLPAGTKLRQWDAEAEGEARLPNGGVIVSKSTDQGRRSWQGDRFHAVLMDEESPLDVVREAEMRTVDYAGRVIHTMTPLHGWTALLDADVRTVTASTRVAWIHGDDNPHVPADVLRELLASMGSHERAARARGEIVAMEGRVYDAFRRDVHVIPAFKPPAHWLRYVGWDFGTTNPTAILWVAHDPTDDVIHVYREHYQRGWSVERHGAYFLQIAQDDPAEWIVSDTDRGVRLTLSGLGIQTVATKKSDVGLDRVMRLGISAIAARLDGDANGKPHLVIHDSCPETIREIESYTWDKPRNGTISESPRKLNDHAMDALRYVVQMGVRRGIWSGPGQIQREEASDEQPEEYEPEGDGPERSRGQRGVW